MWRRLQEVEKSERLRLQPGKQHSGWKNPHLTPEVAHRSDPKQERGYSKK